MPDIFLRAGEGAPADIKLRDPTLPDSGGTVHEVSVSESVVAADVQSGPAEFGVTVAESSPATDSTLGPAVLIGDQGEVVTATATETAVGTFAGSVAETSPAIETQTGLADFSSTRNETVSADDSQTGAHTQPASVSEAVTATETQTAIAVFPADVSEAVASSDSQTGGLVLNVEVAEVVVATDTQTAQAVAVGVTNEVLAATAEQSGPTAYSASQLEALSAVDQSTGTTEGVGTVHNVAVAETLTLVDLQSYPADPSHVIGGETWSEWRRRTRLSGVPEEFDTPQVVAESPSLPRPDVPAILSPPTGIFGQPQEEQQLARSAEQPVSSVDIRTPELEREEPPVVTEVPSTSNQPAGTSSEVVVHPATLARDIRTTSTGVEIHTTQVAASSDKIGQEDEVPETTTELVAAPSLPSTEEPSEVVAEVVVPTEQVTESTPASARVTSIAIDRSVPTLPDIEEATEQEEVRAAEEDEVRATDGTTVAITTASVLPPFATVSDVVVVPADQVQPPPTSPEEDAPPAVSAVVPAKPTPVVTTISAHAVQGISPSVDALAAADQLIAEVSRSDEGEPILNLSLPDELTDDEIAQIIGVLVGMDII